jgi:flagellar motility protein MotE (MotC chaperone)
MKQETTSKKPAAFKIGALTILSLFFAISAVIRVGVEAAPAISRDAGQLATDTSLPPTKTSEPPRTLDHDTFSEVLAALQERERKVQEQEDAVSLRLRDLEMAEKKIDQKLATLLKAEKSLKETLALADGAAQADIDRLIGVYERMKPKDAAALFEEMDPNFAAGFLARMNPDAAASVMAGLTPKTAYTISVYLAGRNSSVPTE